MERHDEVYVTGNDTSHERIGEFLIRIGVMTPEQREHVLEVQAREPHRRFGEIAVELGYIKDSAIDAYFRRGQ